MLELLFPGTITFSKFSPLVDWIHILTSVKQGENYVVEFMVGFYVNSCSETACVRDPKIRETSNTLPVTAGKNCQVNDWKP